MLSENPQQGMTAAEFMPALDRGSKPVLGALGVAHAPCARVSDAVVKAEKRIVARRRTHGVMAAVELAERIVRDGKFTDDEKDVIKGFVGPLHFIANVCGYFRA